ncbi:MAG: hypothetical protein NC201_03720 [Prevotella sp.]|nr:hypothetical protein [Bacteroides sp.]MCM1366337.1 hypothetical protein [Prevotella sp.]MCM1436305.1 hypothetical protein [Prevotella sp.]
MLNLSFCVFIRHSSTHIYISHSSILIYISDSSILIYLFGIKIVRPRIFAA